MNPSSNLAKESDPFDLARFTAAQEGVYPQALSEIQRGRKESHWMWFIFPQMAGLGSSAMAIRYAIGQAEEARAYLAHPVLGNRLRECVNALLQIEGSSASEIFGFPDDRKLQSSLTLFAEISEPASVFVQALDHYFQGERDARTLELLP